MERYVRWSQDGYLSSNGKCFDIGSTVAAALERFLQSDTPFAGSTDPRSAGNGSLMRLAPVALFYSRSPLEGLALAGESSRTTHATQSAVDACRYFAGLLIGALQGRSKEEILSARFCPLPSNWSAGELHPEIDAIAAGSFKLKQPPDICGTGYVVACLEAALWAFHTTESFREGCLKAANLGDDADTTAAVYGQIAGAYYGAQGIPVEWLDPLALGDVIAQIADQLFNAASDRAHLNN